MAIEHEAISTITAKGQTTVPKAVRKALGVEPGGRIAFRVGEGGVTVHRVDEEEDPVIGRFLAFLAEDLERRPEAIRPLTPEMLERARELTEGVEDDPDSPIIGEVDL